MAPVWVLETVAPELAPAWVLESAASAVSPVSAQAWERVESEQVV